MSDLFKALAEVARTFRAGIVSDARTKRLIVLMIVTSVMTLGVLWGTSWIIQNIWF